MTTTNDDENDINDENEILQDGGRIRVGMMMRDSLSPVQRAIADSTAHLCDAFGEPLTFPGCRPGYVFDARTFNDAAAAMRRAEIRDFQKAQLSAEWKGGLEDGDLVTLGDRRMQVIDHRATDGHITLADASQADVHSTRAAAYDAADRDLTSAWRRPAVPSGLWAKDFPHGAKAGDACAIDGAEGVLRAEGNKLICVPNPVQGVPFAPPRTASRKGGAAAKEPSDQVWQMSGPLSDGQSIKDAAYAEAEEALRNAWKR